MKKLIASFIFFYCFSLSVFSQFNVDILVSDDVVTSADTIKLCKTAVYIFTVNVNYTDNQNFDYESASFEWDFGNGTAPVTGTGSMYKTMTSQYQSGAYYLRVKVTDKFGLSKTGIRPVKVSFEPYFYGTNSDLDTICKWDNIKFQGMVFPQIHKYKLPETIEFENERLIWDSQVFSSTLNFNLFELNQQLDNIEQIDYIFVDMEHSDVSSLKIELECPDKSAVTLKNAGGEHSFMGQPVDDEIKKLSIGETFLYSWKTDPKYTTMFDEAGKHTYRYIDKEGKEYLNQSYLPEGSYQSFENLNRLEGCPMNGNWTLKITDTETNDNGFVKKWGIVFKEKFDLPLWKTIHTYTDFDWNGGNIATTLTDGTASDIRIEGQDEELSSASYQYKFSATDDFKCKYDTTVAVLVQKPTITTSPDSKEILQAPVTVNLSTNCAWGNTYNWDLGVNEIFTEKAFEYVYTEGGAPEAKIYKIILSAVSAQGCQDSDTLELSVKAPGHEFETPNIFIPGRSTFKIQMGDRNELREFQCRIYNRWGRMVYKFHDWDENATGWNGKVNGMDAPEGVYFYFIKFEGKDDEKGKQRGFFHLLKNEQ